ncbi:terminal uridylyltransferase 4 isoform X2 [Stigmatopora argus]
MQTVECTFLEPVTMEASLTEQQLGLRQAEDRLSRDYIHRLLKQSPEYLKCQYICKLCSVHIEHIQAAHKHIKEKRHKKNILEKQEENELRALPPPSALQFKAINKAVLEAAKEHGISDDDFEHREDVVFRMENIIKKHLSDSSLSLYGSCLTRFAFKMSDINIDVSHPSTMTQPEVLIQVLDILKNSTEFSDVVSDFHAKVPAIICRDVISGLKCKVSAGNDVACLTTNHMAALTKMEPRLVPLVLAFRYWARLCHIDCQAEGGIPSYSFALMVIFFLQQRSEPILPVYLGHWIEGFDVKRVDEYHLTGIKSDMYVHWVQRPTTSDGQGDHRNDAREQDRSKSECGIPDKTQLSHGLARLTFELCQNVSLGQLWLELIRFYTLEFALEEYIISIRLKELLSRETKNWPRRRLAIEDPFALKRNVARSLNSQMVFEYIQERFRTAYKYFACPQRKCIAHQNRKTTVNFGSKLPRVKKKEDASMSAFEIETNLTRLKVEKISMTFQPSGDVGKSISADKKKSNQYTTKIEKTLEGSLKEMSLIGDNKIAEHRSIPFLSVNDLVDEEIKSEEEAKCFPKTEGIITEDFHYVFDKKIFTGGKPPNVVCSICKRDGHLKEECPDDFKKIELKLLPPMDSHFREILDGLCKLCHSELAPTHDEQDKREQILVNLERFIRKEYNDKAQLCLFGSSKNGFGFHDSDLDICMTLEGLETAEKLNCKEIIEGLAKVLKKHTGLPGLLEPNPAVFGRKAGTLVWLPVSPRAHGETNDHPHSQSYRRLRKSSPRLPATKSGLKNILPISTAKVPIVKFEHKQSGLEGDISLYNTLAQHNTRMLATYAALDERVQFLGCMIKVFAKCCDIGDASRGSLSSYAYILMVLYFLQQRQPPVIPVLQEIFDGTSIPQKIVDGWNAYFFDDLEDLRDRQNLSGRDFNTESIGELWLGLLRFYTENFDFKEHVISIRQKKRLTTFEKQWTSKCIAIEDPFDLNHNLGAGVSRKMTNFIMKAFINGRKLFGTPFYPVRGTEVDYFFDVKVLTDGELAPNDRCCRICGKIGHYMKDCPKKRRIKKKENGADVKEDEWQKKDRRCFQCGDSGHVRRDCPEYRHPKQRSSGTPAPDMICSLVNSKSITALRIVSDCSGRTRLPSESSDSLQTPPYSPQPTAVSQSSPQSSSSPNPFQNNIISSNPQKQATHSQGSLSLFNFTSSHPGQLHFGTFATSRPLPSHQNKLHTLQGQPQNPSHILSSSCPIHRPLHVSNKTPPPGFQFSLCSLSGSPMSSVGSPNAINLNDPSIIFVQQAGRPIATGGPGHEGHWLNHLAQPSSLLENGTRVKSEFQTGHYIGVSQGSHLCEHHKTHQYAPTWPYQMPQNFIHQGSSSYQPGSVVHLQPNMSMVPHAKHPVNFIQQEK